MLRAPGVCSDPCMILKLPIVNAQVASDLIQHGASPSALNRCGQAWLACLASIIYWPFHASAQSRRLAGSFVLSAALKALQAALLPANAQVSGLRKSAFQCLIMSLVLVLCSHSRSPVDEALGRPHQDKILRIFASLEANEASESQSSTLFDPDAELVIPNKYGVPSANGTGSYQQLGP